MQRHSIVVTSALGLFLLAAPCDAALIVATAHLDGPSENPGNSSPGSGFTIVTFDDIAHTLRVQVSFQDLIGVTTVAHIHAAVAPPGNAPVATTVPTFPDFPAGVSSGTYDRTFDTTLLSSFNPAFVTAHGGTAAGAEAFLFASISNGQAYLNIHSTEFPGGEIRGFLQPVPEPSTLALAAIGGAGLAVMCRRRRRRGAQHE